MNVWRIRLKGTDLFYQPVRGRWNENKSNLSPNGKVYIAKKPPLPSIRGTVAIAKSIAEKHNIRTEASSWNKGQLILCSDGYEFEIVQYSLVEECVL